MNNIISSLSSSSSSLRLTKRPLSPLWLINFYSKINWFLEWGGGSGESLELPLLIKTRKAEENRKSRLTREAAHSEYNYKYDGGGRTAIFAVKTRAAVLKSRFLYHYFSPSHHLFLAHYFVVFVVVETDTTVCPRPSLLASMLIIHFQNTGN